MADFTLRSDSVDVDQIMRQIRARIREKRGVDYTEEEIRELAGVKLEKFLDPGKVRSDLLEHYRRQRPATPLSSLAPPPHSYEFDEDTIYVSSRGLVGRTIAALRKLLNPLLKLFFNPNPLISVLHMQGELNRYYSQAYAQQFDRISQRFAIRDELDALNYEVLNNLVVEITRLGIDVKNVKMQVESIASRLDFDERRARALEGVVQYRPGATPMPPPEGGGVAVQAAAAPSAPDAEMDAAALERRRRRRRRRGRRRPEGGGAESASPPPPPFRGDPPGSHADAPPPEQAQAPDRPDGPPDPEQ